MPLLGVLTMWLMLCGSSGCCTEKSGSSWPVDPPPMAACLGEGSSTPMRPGQELGVGWSQVPQVRNPPLAPVHPVSYKTAGLPCAQRLPELIGAH